MKILLLCLIFLHFTTSIPLQDLPQLSRNQLAELAISIEEKIKETENKTTFGGLHDYAYSLSKEDLIRKILEFIRKEGNIVIDFIEKYSLPESNFLQEESESKLVDYLRYLNKKTLLKVAYKVEELTKKRSGEESVSGLRDSIRKDTSVTTIAKEIEKYVNETGYVTFWDIKEIVNSLTN